MERTDKARLYLLVEIYYMAKNMWTHQIFQPYVVVKHQSAAISASTLLVSGFPSEFVTWLQRFAAIQPKEHLVKSTSQIPPFHKAFLYGAGFMCHVETAEGQTQNADTKLERRCYPEYH